MLAFQRQEGPRAEGAVAVEPGVAHQVAARRERRDIRLPTGRQRRDRAVEDAHGAVGAAPHQRPWRRAALVELREFLPRPLDRRLVGRPLDQRALHVPGAADDAAGAAAALRGDGEGAEGEAPARRLDLIHRRAARRRVNVEAQDAYPPALAERAQDQRAGERKPAWLHRAEALGPHDHGRIARKRWRVRDFQRRAHRPSSMSASLFAPRSNGGTQAAMSKRLLGPTSESAAMHRPSESSTGTAAARMPSMLWPEETA
jgi:hypothetical protein